jgi:thiamine phosphate synthase YjbQ (UPF0047 family)
LSPLSSIQVARADSIARAVLSVETSGDGFFEITREVARFLEKIEARDDVLFLFLRHTSASLVIEENADPDVRIDLVTAWTASRRPMPDGCTTPRDPMTCRRT